MKERHIPALFASDGHSGNDRLTFLSIVAAMMVVGIHVGGNTETHGSLMWWWEQIGHHGLFLVAVPFFFVCSGFFWGRHCDEMGWWKRECLKRMRSLLVPYVIWSGVFAVMEIGAVVVANLVHGRDAFSHCPYGWSYWALVIGIHPFAYPLLVPLWYVRSLLIFVVISPLLAKLINSLGWVFVVAVYVVALVCSVAISSGRICAFVSKVFSVGGLFYFCCGFAIALLRVNGFRLSRRLAVFLLIGGFCGVVFKSYIALVTEWRVDRLLVLLFVPPILAGVWALLPAVKIPAWASRLSFPVYILHVPIIFVGGLLFRWQTETMLCWWMRYAFALVGSVSCCWVLKRFSPRVATIAFGGRL